MPDALILLAGWLAVAAVLARRRAVWRDERAGRWAARVAAAG